MHSTTLFCESNKNVQTIDSFVAFFNNKTTLSNYDFNQIANIYYRAQDEGDKAVIQKLCSIKSFHPEMMPSRDSLGIRRSKL